ncbi:abhd13 [Symbiodinium natans]|uniref:Abhd13 protein n=1 Tax=Symbiodinium natans TaxID=878477 RepID=A0A812L4A3_9DINO|nr:abhd13 [Symbiodinium natans]
MSTSAPNVDLKSRGLPTTSVVALVTSVLGLAFFSASHGGSDEDEAAGASSVAWLLWTAMRLGQLLLALVVLFVVVLVSRQRSILYVPVPPGTQRSPRMGPRMFRSPEEWQLPYEDVSIVTEDGVRLAAWFVYQPAVSSAGAVPYTVLYFHGNAGNIGHRLENVKDMYKQLAVNVLIFDYRGYGDSEDGSGPSERGFLQDAKAACRWLVQRARQSGTSGCSMRIREDRILFFGRSIGGAVAIKLAAHTLKQKRDEAADLPLPAGIVLENTFTSLRDMALQMFPFLSPLRPLLRAPLIFDEWTSADSLQYFANNHELWCCCLFSGLQDQIVPPAQMKELYTLLSKRRPKVLKCFNFPLGGHNDTPQIGGADYWASFKKFMGLVRDSEAEREKSSKD